MVYTPCRPTVCRCHDVTALHDANADKDANADTDACDASLQIPQMTQCGCHDVTALHYEDVGAHNLLHHGIEDATFQ
jgi:hypothetical protein